MASLRTMILAPGASWLVFIGLAIVTGTCMMKLPRIETRFSLSDTLVFTSVLLFGPACAAVVAAVDALSASLRFNASDRLFALADDVQHDGGGRVDLAARACLHRRRRRAA